MVQISPQLKQYHERMQFYIKLLGGRCNECGLTHSLEFDHVDPATKFFAIAEAVSRSFPAEVILNELEKCQLLCNACHRRKTLVDNGKAEHGTGGMYRHHGCRCERCKACNRAYVQDFRNRKIKQL
jgi:5-methylcytosine-specific restriction endonuclease McrA